MVAIELMELARDTGFQARVQFIMFDVARDKAPGAAGDDLNFVNGILNGENDVFQLAVGVVVVNVDPDGASDLGLKDTIEVLWPFYAAAWTARTA